MGEWNPHILDASALLVSHPLVVFPPLWSPFPFRGGVKERAAAYRQTGLLLRASPQMALSDPVQPSAVRATLLRTPDARILYGRGHQFDCCPAPRLVPSVAYGDVMRYPP